MLLLSDVRDYLKSLGIAEHYYIGKLDNKQEKSIGVYQRGQNKYKIPVGGLKNKTYDVKSVSILIHWNKNARETEKQALFIFEKLETILRIMIGETFVSFVAMQTAEPVDVGTNDEGVYERVIWMDIYYERVIENGKSESE